ncbi:MAG: hypothetical protein LBE38_02805 [Deltaproteobacteria bacterium]|jgi:hypothetical protein|nr:hypothetical protein [Deltaproteobacteria bacterium]
MPLIFFLMLALNPNLDAASISYHDRFPQRDLTISEDFLFAARPNPYNIGNCYQYKNCLGESIGNMWIADPKFCKPLGGKSWMNAQGRCLNFPDGPQPINPQDFAAKSCNARL